MKGTGKKIYTKTNISTYIEKKRRVIQTTYVYLTGTKKKIGTNEEKEKYLTSLAFSHSMRMNKSKYMKIEANKK